MKLKHLGGGIGVMTGTTGEFLSILMTSELENSFSWTTSTGLIWLTRVRSDDMLSSSENWPTNSFRVVTSKKVTPNSLPYLLIDKMYLAS